MIFNYLKINFLRNKKGFTILESIVAIFVLSLAVSGVFASVQRSLYQSNISKDEIKAYYLAQEAIEIIRNKRDANQLSRIINNPTNNWLLDISSNSGDPCYFGSTCIVDVFVYPNSGWANRCGGSFGSCPNLRQDPNTNLYGYNGSWSETNLKREIQIESINANEISITVRVSWTRGITNKEFKIKTHLLNWI